MSTISRPLQGLIRRGASAFGINLDNKERVASLLAGGAMIAAGLMRRGAARWVLLSSGAGLLFRGGTGHCMLYQQLGIDRTDLRERDGVPGNQGLRIEHEVDIHCPAPQLYTFWRQLNQLPRILRHIESVTPTDEWHSHWVARGPIGPALEWDAEIINEHESELIAWQSMRGAHIKSAGSVRFETLADSLTKVKVCLELQPLGGSATIALARLFGTDPQRELEYDLERFKDFAERELNPISQSLN